MWCIPAEQSADFVAKMEDILDTYELAYDEECPVICINEKPYQLLDERREPVPMKKGMPKRIDNEYERNGTCSVFVMCEPLTGWHHAHARPQRTSIDYAYEIEWLLTENPCKNAPKIKLVQDNLNTHIPASLYKAFPAEKAREYVKRLEFHYTPKHGSWLNIAEISISILSKQCISRRIGSLDLLNSEIAKWKTFYNSQVKNINWQFTTNDARIKLRNLYPVF
jgi:hypothetical protein